MADILSDDEFREHVKAVWVALRRCIKAGEISEEEGEFLAQRCRTMYGEE